MAEAAKAAAAAAQAVEQSSLLDRIVEEGRFTHNDAARERGKDLVKVFVQEVLERAATVPKDAETAINARIAQIDNLVSAQLNEVLHHPDFQKLEGSWRGLKYLLDQSETGEGLKIKIFNVKKTELLRDLQRAAEFDQSALFKKVYEEEFGVFGGAPFSALIGDYEFGPKPEDMELIEKIAQVSASAHAPFLSAASPEMINLDTLSASTSARTVPAAIPSLKVARNSFCHPRRAFWTRSRRIGFPLSESTPVFSSGHPPGTGDRDTNAAMCFFSRSTWSGISSNPCRRNAIAIVHA